MVNVLVQMKQITPDVSELQPVREHRCDQCPNLVFGNQSHYQLHLRQRHKIVIPSNKSSEPTAYHCPVEQCIYHVERKGCRSFSSLRLLRQHYQKSHLDKNFECQGCGEKFLLQRHLEKHECVEHKCPVCELAYNSRAALRTHMRRKNHIADIPTNKLPIPSLNTWNKLNAPPETVPQLPPSDPIPDPAAEEQILCYLPTLQIEYLELIEAQKLDNETQTEFDDLNQIKNEVLGPLLRDIETQTPETRWDQGTMTDEIPEEDLPPVQEQDQNPAPPPVEASTFPAYPANESMFGLQTSAHMYTQTCDELFEELGLSHIQTQTYWPDNLHNTQHTQTCEEMLNELEFLENFQSTYTQTRWLDWQENAEGGEG